MGRNLLTHRDMARVVYHRHGWHPVQLRLIRENVETYPASPFECILPLIKGRWKPGARFGCCVVSVPFLRRHSQRELLRLDECFLWHCLAPWGCSESEQFFHPSITNFEGRSPDVVGDTCCHRRRSLLPDFGRTGTIGGDGFRQALTQTSMRQQLQREGPFLRHNSDYQKVKYCDRIIFTPQSENIGHQSPRNMKSILFEYLPSSQRSHDTLKHEG